MTHTVGLQLRDQSQANLEVCVRTDTAVASWQDAVIERVEELECTGRIGEFRVQSWPRRTRLSPSHVASEVVEAFDRFEEWASRTGRSLRSAFEVRTRESEITGDHEEVLVVPEVCIAVYEAGNLVGVVPHVNQEVVYTVDDFLSELEQADRKHTPRQAPDVESLEVAIDDEQ